MISIEIKDSNGKFHQMKSIDWKWTNAAGWDDIYTGQRARGKNKKGETVCGIAFPSPPRPLSSRPSDY